MRISNYHTHIYLCKHATGTIEEYITKAINDGFQVLGISDHGPISDELTAKWHSRRMSMNESIQYLEELKTLKTQYSDQITLLGAFEIEYSNTYLTRLLEMRDSVDYLVLGQHQIEVDGEFKSIYFKQNHDTIRIYGNTIVEALETGLFKILAHPEIFMYTYPSFDSVCKEVSTQIIEAAIKTNTVLEINANGIRDCYRKTGHFCEDEFYKYPHLEFWRLVSEYQQHYPLTVVINDDSHSVDDFNDQFTTEAYKFAKKLNIKVSNIIEF